MAASETGNSEIDLTCSITAADRLRLLQICRDLELADLEESLADAQEEADLPALRSRLVDVGKGLLREIKRKSAGQPPALPDAEARWARLAPKVLGIEALETRELESLRARQEEAANALRASLAAIPGELLAACRRAAGELSQLGELSLAPSATSATGASNAAPRILRHLALRFGEAGRNVAGILEEQLREHLCSATGDLYSLAVTCDALRGGLEQQESLPASQGAALPPLTSRLHKLWESLSESSPGGGEAASWGNSPASTTGLEARLGAKAMEEALGLSRLQALISGIEALPSSKALSDASSEESSEGAEAFLGRCQEALQRALALAWEGWQQAAEENLHALCAARFNALAGEVDRWLAQNRLDLRRRSGYCPPPGPDLQALRFEIREICRLGRAELSPAGFPHLPDASLDEERSPL